MGFLAVMSNTGGRGGFSGKDTGHNFSEINEDDGKKLAKLVFDQI